jgi:hypothetical protein
MLLIVAATANPAGGSRGEVLVLDFDRRLQLQLRGPGGASDAGLLAHCELDDALGLTTMAAEMLERDEEKWNPVFRLHPALNSWNRSRL